MMVHGCLSNEKILDKFQESNMYVYGEEWHILIFNEVEQDRYFGPLNNGPLIQELEEQASSFRREHLQGAAMLCVFGWL